MDSTIDVNKTQQHFEVNTMFGKFCVDIEKIEDNIVATISGSVIKKEFTFTKFELTGHCTKFLDWLSK